MEPALYITIAFALGYLIGRDISRLYHRNVYGLGYQQALNDVAEQENELIDKVREQASRN